jgi:hypothetical protein
MASFKNRIVVPKIKQPSLPISTILRQDLAIRVSHATCMSHGIIEVLKWVLELATSVQCRSVIHSQILTQEKFKYN